MRAFKVHLNGKKLCLAGIEGDGVLSVIANYVSGRGGSDMFLQVGGLRSADGEHVRWAEQKPLHVGDRIRIEIVDAAKVDAPKARYQTHPAETIEAQKGYVRQMAKKLGWKIQTERPESP